MLVFVTVIVYLQPRIQQSTRLKNHLRCRKPMWRHAVREALIRSCTVQVHTDLGGVQRIHTLRKKRGDHSGQRVTHSTRGHARIAGGIDPVTSIGRGDDGTCTLEYCDRFELGGD